MVTATWILLASILTPASAFAQSPEEIFETTHGHQYRRNTEHPLLGNYVWEAPNGMLLGSLLGRGHHDTAVQDCASRGGRLPTFHEITELRELDVRQVPYVRFEGGYEGDYRNRDRRTWLEGWWTGETTSNWMAGEARTIDSYIEHSVCVTPGQYPSEGWCHTGPDNVAPKNVSLHYTCVGDTGSY